MSIIVRFLLRIFGYVLLAAAIIGGISDASSSIAQSRVILAPLGQVWFSLSPETLNISQAVIQRYIHPDLWDPGIQMLLTWPSWAVLGPLGLLFLWLGTSRKRKSVSFA